MAVDRHAAREEQAHETWRQRGVHVCTETCVLHTEDEHTQQRADREHARREADEATHREPRDLTLQAWAISRGLGSFEGESVAAYGARCLQWMRLRAIETQERSATRHSAAGSAAVLSLLTRTVEHQEEPRERLRKHPPLERRSTEDARRAVLAQQAATLTAEQEFSA